MSARRAKPTPKDDKARFEVRFDPDVFEGLKKAADEAGISINQLVHGISRWASQKIIVGEPVRDEEGYVKRKTVAGCVFFGRVGKYPPPPQYRECPDDDEGDKGELIFSLDFTERRVVKEE